MQTIQKIYNQAKLLVGTLGLVFATILSMQLPFRTAGRFEASFFQYSEFAAPFVTYVLFFATIALVILIMRSQNKALSLKETLQSSMIFAATGTVLLLTGFLSTVTADNGSSLGIGFFLYLFTTGAIIGLHGYKLYLNKEETSKLVDTITGQANKQTANATVASETTVTNEQSNSNTKASVEGAAATAQSSAVQTKETQETDDTKKNEQESAQIPPKA